MDYSHGRLAWLRTALAVLIASSWSGCNSGERRAIEAPQVDPASAAAKAIELYDKNADGVLSRTELAACPGILAVREHFDANRDDQVSQDEIAERIKALFSMGIGLTPVTCTVLRGSAPLDKATVRFVPDSIFGGALKAATGTTDVNGTAVMAIPDSDLPANQAGLRSMQPGIYRVEIEHPSIAESTAALGCEIDPAARGGTEPKFRL
jgi:hypothetical protein